MQALSGWTAKFDDPAVKQKFADFNKTLQFDFPDQQFNIHMAFKDQTCELKPGPVDNPDIVITASSDVIVGISRKTIKPLLAFVTGKLKAKGNRMAMLKIQLLNK